MADLEPGINDLLWANPRPEDVLVIVTDASAKSQKMARRMLAIADKLRVERTVVVANKIRPDEREVVDAAFGHLERIVIPYDPKPRRSHAQRKQANGGQEARGAIDGDPRVIPGEGTYVPPPGGWALYGALIMFGAAAALAPFLGPFLGVRLDSQWPAKLADHALPGALVIAAAVGLALGEASHRRPRVSLTFLALLGGVWMSGSHLPLVVQAVRGHAGWIATLWHALPAVLVLATSGLLVARALMVRDLQERGTLPPSR